MRRLTIATDSRCISLGINGVISFWKVMDVNEFNSIQLIDANFIAKLERMETHPFGFTSDYKIKFLKTFTDQLGKKCLITFEWISQSNEARAQYHINAVKLINQGKSIEEINAHLKYR